MRQLFGGLKWKQGTEVGHDSRHPPLTLRVMRDAHVRFDIPPTRSSLRWNDEIFMCPGETCVRTTSGHSLNHQRDRSSAYVALPSPSSLSCVMLLSPAARAASSSLVAETNVTSPEVLTLAKCQL